MDLTHIKQGDRLPCDLCCAPHNKAGPHNTAGPHLPSRDPVAAGKAVHEEADRILRDTPLIDPAAVAAQLVAWSERNLTEEK